MILKRWIPDANKWEFIDKVQKFSHQLEINEATKEKTLFMFLLFENEEEQKIVEQRYTEDDKGMIPNHIVYLLNDEGKTIERIS